MRVAVFSLGLATVAAVLGCPSGGGDHIGPSKTTTLSTKPAIYLRVTPDGDASDIIGAFVPDEVADSDIDESAAVRTRCSKFITAKRTPASGQFSEVAAASSSASGKLGVKSIAKVDLGGSSSEALLVRYALIEKMSADVDEDNLARCCETAPDQCSKRYIAGALLADGNYYAATQAGSGGSADLEALRISELPIDAAIVFDNDMKWERKVGFKRQYFAFNVRRGLAGGLGNAKADDKSCDWVNNLPSSLDGKFYVGTGKPELSTQAARDTALANVKDQIIKDLGEWITETSSTTTSISAAGKEAATLLEGSQVREHMQGGVARDIEAKKWCGPNVIASPDGQYQEYQVLAFFSHKARYTASKLALKEIIRVQKAANRNTAALEEFLAAVEKDSPK